MRSIQARVTDARDYARKAAECVRDISFDEFASDAATRHAVCYCLLVLGEACAEAAKALRPLPPEIPWAENKGMRNILIHEYWQIDEAIVYNVARNEAVPLAERLDNLLSSWSLLFE